MSNVCINWNEDKDELKRMNYNEPVLEIHTPYSHAVIPASRVCYHNIKQVIDDAERRIEDFESIKML